MELVGYEQWKKVPWLAQEASSGDVQLMLDALEEAELVVMVAISPHS